MHDFVDSTGVYHGVSRGWASCSLNLRDIRVVGGMNEYGSSVARSAKVTNPYTDHDEPETMTSTTFFPSAQYPKAVVWSCYFEAIRDLIYLVGPDELYGEPYGSLEQEADRDAPGLWTATRP